MSCTVCVKFLQDLLHAWKMIHKLVLSNHIFPGKFVYKEVWLSLYLVLSYPFMIFYKWKERQSLSNDDSLYSCQRMSSSPATHHTGLGFVYNPLDILTSQCWNWLSLLLKDYPCRYQWSTTPDSCLHNFFCRKFQLRKF